MTGRLLNSVVDRSKRVRTARGSGTFSCLLLLAVCFCGCRPSTDEIGRTVKSSMQQTFDSDSRIKDFHLTVESITVIKTNENTYRGLATIKSPNLSKEITLTITTDGKSTIWETEQGAFLPFEDSRQSSFPPPIPNIEPWQSKSFTTRAIYRAQNDYRFKAKDPDELRHGFWTASELPQSRTAPISGDRVFVIVHYSVLEKNISCEWMVDFPDPHSYSFDRVNDCVREMFDEVPVSPPNPN